MTLRLAALALLATFALGCGAGAPLLHPARTLPTGDVRVAGGLFANVAPGSLGTDLKRAKDVAAADAAGTSSPGTPGTNPTYAKGALVAAAIGPGIAPFVAARVGVGNRAEAGLGYTGRGVRVDLRRAFESGPWALSVGVGGSAALYGRQSGSDLPNVDLGKLHGYGVDVPVLVGWDSDGGLYHVWFGARGGYEHVNVDTLASEPLALPAGSQEIKLSADHFFGGGVLGFATGFHHVHVAIEGQVGYQVVSGSYNANDVTVKGFTITPATALWWTF